MTEPRSWRIKLPIEKLPLNMNTERKMHWTTKRKHVANLRTMGKYLAMSNKVPALGTGRVTLITVVADNRRRDPINLYPNVKALVDGLVDAGVFEDDDYTRVDQVSRIDYDPPTAGFYLLIEELT